MISNRFEDIGSIRAIACAYRPVGKQQILYPPREVDLFLEMNGNGDFPHKGQEFEYTPDGDLLVTYLTEEKARDVLAALARENAINFLLEK